MDCQKLHPDFNKEAESEDIRIESGSYQVGRWVGIMTYVLGRLRDEIDSIGRVNDLNTLKLRLITTKYSVG